MGLDAVDEAKRRRVPERGVRAVLDQPAGGVPLTESRGVVQWGDASDHRAGRFDVGAGLDERLERFDVVAAGSPM